MPTAKVTCPGCGASLGEYSALFGRIVHCPECGAQVRRASPEETNEGHQPSGRRIPCPICAELILPEAVKCRFCGHVIGPQQKLEGARLNVPALAGLALGLFAWPVVALCFFFVFGQLIQSALAGLTVSAAAVGCGVAGLLVALRRRARSTGGLTLSLTGIVLGMFGATTLLVYVALAKRASDALGESVPLVRQVLGTEKAAAMRMQCAACGHQFEARAVDVLTNMAGDTLQALASMRDVNEFLDEYERKGPVGMTCPECGSAKGFPMSVCPRCGREFLPAFYGASGRTAARMTCPHCGAEIPFDPLELFRSGQGQQPRPEPSRPALRGR